MEVFLQSLGEFAASFSVNKAVMFLMAVFVVIGGADKMRGNKKGYGQEFDAGFQAMGPLAIAMVGMIALVPVIQAVFGEALGAFFSRIGADPSLFAGIFIDTDLGGYSLAMGLAEDEAVGNFNGMIVTAMMGAGIVFNIPVGVSMIREEDRSFFASGMLIGFATIPAGCLAGGLVMIAVGYEISTRAIIMNTIPVAAVSLLIVLGLIFFRETLIKCFIVFGKGVTKVVVFGTITAVFQYLTGIRLPLFHIMVEEDGRGVIPLIEAVQIVGCIGLVLIGAFPMIRFITNAFGARLKKGGEKLGMDETAIAGMIAAAANNIPTFQMLENMSPKGKIMNCAFMVSASWVLGDHLAFCAGANPDMIAPMLAAKFAGGSAALALAGRTWKRFVPDEEGRVEN